jgi:hypothetical protein
MNSCSQGTDIMKNEKQIIALKNDLYEQSEKFKNIEYSIEKTDSKVHLL